MLFLTIAFGLLVLPSDNLHTVLFLIVFLHHLLVEAFLLQKLKLEFLGFDEKLLILIIIFPQLVFDDFVGERGLPGGGVRNLGLVFFAIGGKF